MRGAASFAVFVAIAVMASRPAAARPTVAVAGIEVSGDGVGVDVEATAVARELTQALRRQADLPNAPLQLIDPMMVADDVESLVWGKLIRDGDSYIITTHLSAIGSDGDTVSYRAHVRADDTSSVDIARWAKVIYTSLLEQIDLDDKTDDVPAKPMTEAEILAVRDPSGVVDAPFDDDHLDDSSDDPVLTTRDPPSRKDRDDDDPDAAQARRALMFSGALAIGGFATWTYAALRVSDAQNQLTRLTECSVLCIDAIEAANRQGERWERVSYIAAPITMLATAASIYFGYKGYAKKRRSSSSSDLVGIAPVIAPGHLGAAATIGF
jgi:hypothetical protein